MKKIHLPILLSLVIMFSVEVVFAESNTYVIGIEDIDYIPFYSGTQKDKCGGYAGEFLDTFAKAQGYTFIYQALPIRRLYKYFIEQEVDFKFPDNPYWKAEDKKGKNVVYSKSVVDFIDGVMVLPENKGKGIDELKSLSIVMGFTAWDYLDLINEKKIKISENRYFPGVLKQVIIGRVDGAYINPSVARYQLENVMNKPNALTFDASLPHTKGSYMMSTIKYPDVIEKLNIYLEQNKQAIEEMRKRHKTNITN